MGFSTQIREVIWKGRKEGRERERVQDIFKSTK
jgi:hypothetical protein